MNDVIGSFTQILPEVLLALWVFLSLINQINAQRARREEIRLKEREELLEKIDSLEKKIILKTEEVNRLITELEHARSLAAKVPIMELQMEELRQERGKLVERIRVLEVKFKAYEPVEITPEDDL